jgi:hypothetical protein
MIRNLKTLGLALVAVFAFCAVNAAGAMAQTAGHLTTPLKQTFTLTGTEVAGNNNAFTGAFGVTVRCPGSTYAGHTYNNTPHAFIHHGDTKVTITPKYINCVDQDGDPRTVDMNGCDFALEDATTTAANTYAVKADVECTGSNKIKVTGGACAIEVGTQTGLTGLHIKNETGDLRLTGSVKLKATVCGFSTTATQDQDVTVKAHDEQKNPIDVSISD